MKMNRIFGVLTLLMMFTVQAQASRVKCPGKSLDPESLLNRIRDAEQASYLLNAELANGSEQDVPDETVRRFELFRFEKDYNPRNILHYGIDVNVDSCTFATRPNGAPRFNTYWIMGEERGQRKTPTRKDLERLGPSVLEHTPDSIRFTMRALSEINIRKREIELRAEMVNGNCRVRGYVDLDDGREISLNRIFAEISTVIGIPTGVSSLTVDGRDSNSNQPVSLTFD
jgi:hypothetical protein